MGGDESAARPSSEPGLTAWADRLETACAGCPSLGIRRVRVFAETASTQDAAWEASAGREGWLVVAGRQYAGRGRLGRRWLDTAACGVAMTFTLPAARAHSVGVGVAVCCAIRECVPIAEQVGLRWPNDVVEREQGRKLAGVLVEVRNGVALAGIGINIGQRESEFDPGLQGRAVSIRQLGGDPDRLRVAERVVVALDAVLGCPQEEIASEALAMDTLVGTQQRFVHDGQELEGEVLSIDPDGSIRVAAVSGGVVRLPASTTSLVHD